MLQCLLELPRLELKLRMRNVLWKAADPLQNGACPASIVMLLQLSFQAHMHHNYGALLVHLGDTYRQPTQGTCGSQTG